jgi:hypothetical protein
MPHEGSARGCHRSPLLLIIVNLRRAISATHRSAKRPAPNGLTDPLFVKLCVTRFLGSPIYSASRVSGFFRFSLALRPRLPVDKC